MRNGVTFQLVLPDELHERVKDYQFANRIETRTAAMRELLERGLTSKAKR